MALALRRLASGPITNDEFDDVAFAEFSHRTDDPALAELSIYGWLHYSDLSTYRLRGRHAIAPEERTSIARTVLFLKSNQEYVHGESITSGTCLGGRWLFGFMLTIALAVLTGIFTHYALGAFWLGLGGVALVAYVGYWLFVISLGIVRRRQWRKSCPGIPDTSWPYMDDRASQEQYGFWPFRNDHLDAAALADPPFLCGVRAA